MTALDDVLADLVEADGECSYVTVKRVLLEALIEEWVERGDRLDLIASMVGQLHAVVTTVGIVTLPRHLQLLPASNAF